ncbi:MAG: polysaccharide pyruvyl transferase family protein, partial [Planctomycetia bacterium]
RHRLLGPERFADVCTPLVGKRVGYVRPEGNVGDELIELAMTQLFTAYGIRWSLVSCEAGSPSLDRCDVLVFGGGGNMGTRYTGNHELRGRALATGLPLVILPQSFTSPEDRPFHRVYVREAASLALRPDGILAPDLALGLEWSAPPPPSHDLGVYLRRDRERGGRKPLLARDPVRLARTPADYLAPAARYRRIVTDRLHFAVAGLHAGRQVTLVANDYHKNRSMHATWLADLGCRFAASAAEALQAGRRAA